MMEEGGICGFDLHWPVAGGHGKWCWLCPLLMESRQRREEEKEEEMSLWSSIDELV